MAEPADQEFLRSIFLMEAWDTLVALEQGVGALCLGPVSMEAGEDLFVVTHRLKGAASLHGFPGVAALADDVGRILESLPGAGAPEREEAATRIDALVTRLKSALDTVAATGSDGIALDPGPESDPDPVRADLQTFFTDHADVLSYFAPEAAEHLDAMATALLALQSGGDADDIDLLFRAVHTLKGAAYVVGCQRVGEVAHRIEDLLVEARDGELTMTAPMIESVFAAMDVMRLMLGMSADTSANMTVRAEAALAGLVESFASAPPGVPRGRRRAGPRRRREPLPMPAPGLRACSRTTPRGRRGPPRSVPSCWRRYRRSCRASAA